MDAVALEKAVRKIQLAFAEAWGACVDGPNIDCEVDAEGHITHYEVCGCNMLMSYARWERASDHFGEAVVDMLELIEAQSGAPA